MQTVREILTELCEKVLFHWSVYSMTSLDRDCISHAEEQITLEQQNIGAGLMASQIRKSIETGSGRFSDENANWILDRIEQIEGRMEQLVIALGAAVSIIKESAPSHILLPDLIKDYKAALAELEGK